MNEEDADDSAEFWVDSGPFCQHWGELGCCDDPCACGHACKDHDPYEDGRCEFDDCGCASFLEPA